MYSIHSFSDQAIAQICAEHTGRSLRFCATKDQVNYLTSYLHEMECKSILLETPYVDREYLEDFAEYYVRCFKPYSRFCARLHFFSSDLEQSVLEDLLQGDSAKHQENLQSDYLGFSVIKPLPDAFVGRTCLTTYESDKGRRHYPMTRPYQAHIAGTVLTVSSLAFQEQDTVVAACATASLWSALHKSADIFGTATATPARVTEIAGRDSFERTLPSHGFQVREMCRAIKGMNLEVELRTGHRIDDIREVIYGYGHCGIPLILGLDFVTPEGAKPYPDGHAVTTVGYSLKPGVWGNKLLANNIDQIYVHDDQHGPFARSKVVDGQTIETKWKVDRTPLLGKIFTVIIPVYHKIRITYENAREETEKLDWLLELCGFNACWEIRLTPIPQFLKEVADSEFIPREVKKKVLDSNWPRFQWRLTAWNDGVPILEALLDATDIERSFFVKELVFLDAALQKRVRDLVSDATRSALIADEELLGEEWVGFLMKKLGVVA